MGLVAKRKMLSLAALAAVLGLILASTAFPNRPFASMFPVLFAGRAALATAGAVVDGVSLDPARGIGAGSWVTVYGTNLTTTTQSWQAADFVDGRAPTRLAGVSVTIGGQAAFVAFVGRGADFGADYDQVNVLAPSNLVPGPAEVELTTADGTTLTASVAVNSLVPGFFAFEPRGRRFAAATGPDGAEYIGHFDLFGTAPLDRPIRPARRDELITIYGAGCGRLDPPVADGMVAAAASRVVENVSIRIGEMDARIEYAGAAPGLVGVCQFNVRIPLLEPGEWELVARIGNVETQRGTHVAVEKAPYDAWDHLGFSEFRLTGAHVFVECTDCHLRGRFRGTPSACAACHLERYQMTTSPNHAAQGYPADCALCHSTSQFRGAQGGARHTNFEMTGAHAGLECSQCHRDGLGKVDAACSSCHLANYQATTSPNHVAADYPQDCSVCHNTESFRGAAVNHSETRFPLTGRHTELACDVCHGSPAEAPQPECVSCHLVQYQATAAPNHQAEGYPASCETCHNTTSFRGATLRHPVEKFPLEGGHAALGCQACHASDSYAGLESACASCHADRYNATSAPSHAASGYPQDCALCHTVAGWLGADASHPAFALTGAHRAAACSGCHVDGKFAGAARNCDACHLPAFQAATSPDHEAAGFPRSCELCHGTTQFAGGRFAHARFALTGAHTSASCAQCHSSGTYAGTPTTCASCHTAGTNPSHAGFPATCQSCHSTSGWAGATFSHSAFPIYSGKHKDKWSSCSSCHTIASDFSVFSCFGCHSQSKMTEEHEKVGGFAYDSVRCYQCHPQGKAD